jgi:hypothetical protein
MIDKLALFCYRKDIDYGVFCIIAIATAIFLFMRYWLKIPGNSIAIFFLIMTTVILVLLYLIFFTLLEIRGSRLPEVILEKAQRAFGEGPIDPNIRKFFEQWLLEAERGRYSNLLDAWPIIKRIIANEKIIREAKKNLRKDNNEIATFIRNNNDIEDHE